MIEAMMRPESWIIVILLLLLIWVNQRAVKADAYRLGATQGFMLGIDRTIKVMREQQMVSDNDLGTTPTREELIKKLAPLVTIDVIADMRKMEKDERK